jgi:hypothetical protein
MTPRAAAGRIERAAGRTRLPVLRELGATGPRSLPTAGPRGGDDDADDDDDDGGVEVARPTTRGDCLPGGCNAARPCPFVSCAAHLALEVRGHGSYATIKETFPGVEVWDMAETCALDVADRGGAALAEVAALLNLSPERTAQIEALATETAMAPRGSRGPREP